MKLRLILQAVSMLPLCYLVEDGSIAEAAIQHISSAEAGQLQYEGKEPLLQLRFSTSGLKHPTVMERALQVSSAIEHKS